MDLVDRNGQTMSPGCKGTHIHPASDGVNISTCDFRGVSGAAGHRTITSGYSEAWEPGLIYVKLPGSVARIPRACLAGDYLDADLWHSCRRWR
jgi:hypothetical protein